MRLFVAIVCNDEMKNSLFTDGQELRELCSQGNFTRKENFHITLAFIGETPRVDAAKKAVKEVQGSPFFLELDGFGNFGKIYWRGIKPDGSLQRLQNQVAYWLKKEGFSLDSRPFKPHFTLARQVKIQESFDKSAFSDGLSPARMKVEKISLMKSERVDGRLVYTEIFSKKLTGEA